MGTLSANDLQIIQAGQAAINRRRAEFAYMQNGSRASEYRPTPPKLETPQERPQQAQADQPETVTFYLVMGLQAARRYSNIGGAWRLYVLAKALDNHGREAIGSVQADDLRAFALHLGVNPRTYRRWYRQAVNAGLLDPIQDRRGAWRLILPSPGKAALYMGADDIGRKVEISAADLIGAGWKARVNAGLSARGLQISRERQQKTYNIPASTQRYRDNQAGVNRTANYACSDYKADELQGLKEFSNHKGLFVASNKRVYWRLPDTRQTNIATDAGKGRGRKAKAELKTLQEQDQNGALKMQRALSGDLAVNDNEFVRLFCHTSTQRKASERKAARQDNLSVSEIYQAAYENKTSGAGVWDVFGQM